MDPKKGSAISFKSSALEAAFTFNADAFDLHQAHLNSVSEDIKATEAFLREKGIHVTFEYDLGVSRQDKRRYSLAWDDYQSHKRLLLRQFSESFQGFVEMVEKPLIEWKTDQRLAAFNSLPEFVDRIAARLRSYQDKRIPDPFDKDTAEKQARSDAPTVESAASLN